MILSLILTLTLIDPDPLCNFNSNVNHNDNPKHSPEHNIPRWSKTEGDVPPGGPDVWSTACGDVAWGAGSPPENCTHPSTNPPLYYPSGTDYTLQSGDTWFWEPPKGDAAHPAPTSLRNMDELIYTYHSTVGHNTNLELDFAIDRDGLVAPAHAALYARLGDWIRGCYGPGNILASGTTNGGSGDDGAAALGVDGDKADASVTVELSSSQEFDRVMLQEDQTQGQRVRGWLVEWKGQDGSWRPFAQGASIGNKRISLAPGALLHNASSLRLTLTRYVGDAIPRVTLSVPGPCPTGSLPTITKLGTEDIGMTETTPVVMKGQLYRFESVCWVRVREDKGEGKGGGRG